MKKKNILIAFLMLLLTGVALSTASYAWFTANTSIQLGRIDVQVQATNGVQVSTDATNWKGTLTTDELRNAYYSGGGNTSVTQFPDVDNDNYLQPVSTAGTITSGKFNMFYGQLQTDGSITLTTATETSGTCNITAATTSEACTAASGTWVAAINKCTVASVHTKETCITTGTAWAENPSAYFIAFDLFIQSSGAANLEIGLLPTSTVAINTGTDAGLKSSIRVGFINLGVDNTFTQNTSYALNTATEYSIWEPNAEIHTPKAISQGTAVNGTKYAYKGVIATGEAVVLNNATQFSDAPVQSAGEDNIISTKSTNDYFLRATSMTTATYPSTNAWSTENYPTMFTVHQGINKVRLYIWIEGQDVDCENSASLGSAVGVTINLNAKQ